MQILEIDGFVARCEAKGIERDVSLFMLSEGSVKVGDFVVVHVGHAIQRISELEARSAWEVYDQILAADRSTASAG